MALIITLRVLLRNIKKNNSNFFIILLGYIKSICIFVPTNKEKHMKNTTNIINNTKNEVLKTIMSAMKTDIAKMIDSAISYEEKVTGKNVTAFEIESIELNLIYDLVKAVEKYTEDTDKVLNFSTGISIKGNLEIMAEIERGGKSYSYVTEVIVADGMINRRHLRYITKTTLPKSTHSVTTNLIKDAIKLNKKALSFNKFISIQESQKAQAIKELKELKKDTEEEVIEAINNIAEPMLVNNWNELESSQKDFHKTEAEYTNWLEQVNKNTIKNYQSDVYCLQKRIKNCNKNIAKEKAKLEKLGY